MSTACLLAPAGTQEKHHRWLKTWAWVMLLPPTDLRWACHQCLVSSSVRNKEQLFLSSSQSSGQLMCQKLCVRQSAAFRKTNVNSLASNIRSHCQNRLWSICFKEEKKIPMPLVNSEWYISIFPSLFPDFQFPKEVDLVLSAADMSEAFRRKLQEVGSDLEKWSKSAGNLLADSVAF